MKLFAFVVIHLLLSASCGGVNLPFKVIISKSDEPGSPKESKVMLFSVFPDVSKTAAASKVSRSSPANGPGVQIINFDPRRPAPSKSCAGDGKSFKESLIQLALNLNKNLKKYDENLVVCSEVVACDLAMLYDQSSGKTRAQIEKAFKMDDRNKAFFHVYFFNRVQKLNEFNKTYQPLVSNRVYFSRNYQVKVQQFKKAKTAFGITFDSVDFTNDGKSVMEKMNRFAAESSLNNIRVVLERPPSPTTQMLLVSTVFFKGCFQKHFHKHLTKDGVFRMRDGKSKKVSMMSQKDVVFPYLDHEPTQHQFLLLRYIMLSKDLEPDMSADYPKSGRYLALLLALPKAGKHLPDLDKTMTPDLFCQLMTAMNDTKLAEVALPKFRIDSLLFLKQPLVSLGVSDMFDSGTAKLAGMSANDQHKMYVDEVVSRVAIQVDEGDPPLSFYKFLYANEPEDSFKAPFPSFVVDHAFRFYVISGDRDDKATILFSGHVIDP